MMKKKLLLTFALFAGYMSSAKEVVNLNRSWKFTANWEVRHNVFTEINLPHNWNQDALAGVQNYYRGVGNYEKGIDVPSEWSGKVIYLRFKGVNSVANVFVNGVHQLEHRGGYTAFCVDISKSLKYGETNKIMVRANNAPTLDVMPLLGDFNMYGGIYRDVDILVAEPTHISVGDYGSSGVYVTQQTTKECAKFETKILIESQGGNAPDLTIELLDKDRNIVTSKSTAVKINEGHGLANVNFEVKDPNLWNGTKSPYLYELLITLKQDGKVVDVARKKIGFRFFSVDPNEGFFLNGERVQLQGVCRHQDRAEIGNALSKIHHEDDMNIMREMGVNAIRLAHYPQDEYFYDLCDRYGFIIWAEIPFIGPGGYRDKGFVDQESFRNNGKQQLIELIRQNYNHPSICFWGLFNELKTEGDNPCQYLEELNALAHQEDPSRLTTSATNQNNRELNSISDVVAWNQYFGWYGGDPSSIGAWADATHKAYPDKAIGISEYGAGASILHQQEELVKPVANSYWHPENWQTYYHEEHWKEISKRPFLWGTFVWNMFDFGAAHRTEGEINGKNDKGLVTFDRHFKKDAFYFYKANWNREDKFVYIAERRVTERKNKIQKIKVYSNSQQSVELLVNGKSLGAKRGEYGTIIWEDVELCSGENTLEAVVKRENLKDVIVVNLSE